MEKETKQKQQNFGKKILEIIEKIGNKLPDPITLFFLLSLGVIIISAIAATLNISAIHPGTKETIKAISLLSADNIRRIFTEADDNFATFPPLATVLVAMLGVGVAETTGLLSVCLRKLVLIAPSKLICPVVVFAGIMSNLAADAGYVVLVPLGAIIFLAFNRHPLAGLAAAFAGVSGGFSANLLVSGIDPLLSGLSESAAHLIDPNYQVLATSNYYFMAISTFIVTGMGWLVTEKFIEPKLGSYEGEVELKMEQLTLAESKGLRWAGYALLAFVAFILVMVLPPEGILRQPETFTIIPSPFLNGIVFIIALGFFIPAIFYGIAAGTIHNDKDVAKALSVSMSSMGYYIALAFITAQFISYFSWSNLGAIMAIGGANFLQSTGFTGLPLLLMFIIVSLVINLFVGSASAKWAIMAPVFVPMLMLLGFSPELTQTAYRIGDSTTNIISPLLPYFPIIVAFGQKYQKDLKLGTLISLMIPYSIAFFLGWCALFIIWFLFGLPLGPGVELTV